MLFILKIKLNTYTNTHETEKVLHPGVGQILEGCTNMDTYCSIADTTKGMLFAKPQKSSWPIFCILFKKSINELWRVKNSRAVAYSFDSVLGHRVGFKFSCDPLYLSHDRLWKPCQKNRQERR